MKNTLTRLLPVLALCWLPARADVISYSDSGTFSASTPSDALGFSGPSETWAFHFEADSNPTILESGNGGVNFAFSDFSYSLDGPPVAVAPTFIRFFSGGNGGGFEICFNGAFGQPCSDGLGTYGPQMYSGMTSAPTLSTGAFTSNEFGVIVDGTTYDEPNNTAVATPEPSTLLTLALGLSALCAARRLHLRS